MLGQDHIWKGEILTAARDLRGALDEYRKGASYLESLMNGTTGLGTRGDIAECYTKVGAALALIGDTQQASIFYAKALTIVEPPASAKPPNVLALYAAADAYFGMGELARGATQRSASTSREEEQQHLRAACDWYRKSADAWREIPNPGRTTPSGFSTRGPESVARNLLSCEAMLKRSNKSGKCWLLFRILPNFARALSGLSPQHRSHKKVMAGQFF